MRVSLLSVYYKHAYIHIYVYMYTYIYIYLYMNVRVHSLVCLFWCYSFAYFASSYIVEACKIASFKSAVLLPHCRRVLSAFWGYLVAALIGCSSKEP